MVMVPVSILGGLPVIASVWFSGPDYEGEYDAGVDNLYWQKRDGTSGKEVTQAIYDRVEKADSYWQASCTEQANDWLAGHCPAKCRDHTVPGGYRTEGEWSAEYIALNGDPRQREGGAA